MVWPQMSDHSFLEGRVSGHERRHMRDPSSAPIATIPVPFHWPLARSAGPPDATDSTNTPSVSRLRPRRGETHSERQVGVQSDSGGFDTTGITHHDIHSAAARRAERHPPAARHPRHLYLDSTKVRRLRAPSFRRLGLHLQGRETATKTAAIGIWKRID